MKEYWEFVALVVKVRVRVRVFSDCGLRLTAKWSRLKGYVLQDQVMIWHNACCVDITQDNIAAKLSKTN